MFNRIRNLAAKEFIQLTRDVMMLVLIIVGPTLELTLMARATSQGFHHLPAVVVDQDHSQLSREIAASLNNTEELLVVAYLDSPAEIDRWLESSEAVLAVTLPAGLEADLALHGSQVQVLVDGANSTSGAYAIGAATGALNVIARKHLALNGRSLPMITVRSQVRYNPTLRIADFTISAQLGFIVYQVVLIVASLGLTRERELGTLEQLLVTPYRRLELIIGKAIPALVVGAIDFVIVWAITVQVYDLPMRGSFPLLFGLSALFIIAEIGWGLIISAVSRTQQQAVLFVFVLAMTDVAFSGYMVLTERLPVAMQWLSQIFPLQHYLIIIRSVMLKGADFSTLWPQALALVVLAILSGSVALFALRRRLD